MPICLKTLNDAALNLPILKQSTQSVIMQFVENAKAKLNPSGTMWTTNQPRKIYLQSICFSCGILACLGSPLAAQNTDSAGPLANQLKSQVELFIKDNGAKILSELKQFIKLPNVSSMQNDVRRNAEFLIEQFGKRGADMQLLEVPGANPVVYGEILQPGATRTVLIYAHYDGQPVNSARWQSTQPFQPALYSEAIEKGGTQIDWPEQGDQISDDWRIYGRSTSDDKAPFIALLAALDCLKQKEVPITSNIKFFFDGEEEIGSPNMKRALDRYRERFRDVDLWVFCDGPLHQSRKPTVYFGVRGVTGFEITVYGATRNLHSGHYGNWAPNPGLMMSELLASMKDEHGNVIIKDFYKSVVPLTQLELKALKSVPKIDDALRQELGLVETENQNQSYLERMQLPSLNIKGIECGKVGAKARNIVPDQATVSMDIRLANGNMPSQMVQLVKNHIEAQGYKVVDRDPVMKTRRENKKIAKLTTQASGYPAAKTSMSHPQVLPLTKQLESFSEEKLLKIPSLGGSLPLYLISDFLKQPLVILPFANHDNNQHSPDENMRVGNLFYGVKAMAAILTMEQAELVD